MNSLRRLWRWLTDDSADSNIRILTSEGQQYPSDMTPQRRAQQILRLHASRVNIPDDVLRDARSLLAGPTSP